METETQEPLTDEFIALLRGAWSNANIIESHWQGCEYSHSHCAVVRLCDEVMRLRRCIEQMEDES